MTISTQDLPVVFNAVKDAYQGTVSKAEASRRISQELGIKLSSATNIVGDFATMMTGRAYKRRLNVLLTDYFLDSIFTDFGVDALSTALKALDGHITYLEKTYRVRSRANREIYDRFDEVLRNNVSDSRARLSASTLAEVTPEFIWWAVQELLDGASMEPFGPSTDYDLIADDDIKLPPKAVFGRAASYALNRKIEPKHFSGDDTSPCFRLLRAAGYRILPKGATVPSTSGAEQEEWEEGKRVLRAHVARERAPGLAKAKKAQYLRVHRVLKCEACGLEPTAHYDTSLAESCIEVHHKTKLVSQMAQGHRTRLEDLECLCANCHRLVHRRLRESKKAEEKRV
jgi:hypothetical protein